VRPARVPAAAGTAGKTGPARGRGGAIRRHAPLLVILVPAITLRVLTIIAYRTAFEFYGDSYSYLDIARHLRPDPVRPIGYPLLLRALSPTGELWVVTAVQHLAGIGMGIALYALLRHRGVAGWLAALAAAPVLLDAYQIAIEQFVLAETLFSALLVGAFVALAWSRRPAVWACALAGGLLALATATRTVGTGLGALVFVYLIVRRVGVVRPLVFAGSLGLPVLAYAGWYAAVSGQFGLSGSDGPFLYGRVAPFANCALLKLTATERELCSPHPPSDRPDPNFYVWNRLSPRNKIPSARQDTVLGDFAHKVISAQPGEYASVVAGDVTHYFAPGRWVGRRDWYLDTWRFPNSHGLRIWHASEPLQGFSGDLEQRHLSKGLAAVLRGYQRDGFVQGPVLAGMVVLALVVPFAVRRRTGIGWVRADCLLLVAAGMVLLIIPSATVCFDYRYLLPTLVLFPPAAALAGQQLLPARRGRDGARTAPDTGTGAGDKPDPDGAAGGTTPATVAAVPAPLGREVLLVLPTGRRARVRLPATDDGEVGASVR
jgi:hypothetical protein